MDTKAFLVHVPTHIHKAFKVACVMQNISMTRAITMLMGRYAENTLKQKEQPPPTTHTVVP